MSWCCEHLRDCAGWRESGQPLSTTSDEAARYLDATIRQYISWIQADELGGLPECLRRIHNADPNFVMGEVIRVAFELIGSGHTTRLDPKFKAEVDALRAKEDDPSLYPWEKLHVQALSRFADGFLQEACQSWGAILEKHPCDLLALKLSHDTYFYLGDRANIRDGVLRVLPHWNKGMPLFGHLKGMLAFGLEENAQYEEALKAGFEALEINKSDAWATHAVAHVYEMQGRPDDGVRFLSSTLKDWNPCATLACHNHWHWAIYHIERGESDVALGMFDREVGKRAASGEMLDLVDASSLLLRLQIEGVSVGVDRWKQVSGVAAGHGDDHILVFNEAHIATGLLGAGQSDDAEAQHRSLVQFVKSGVGTNRDLSERFGVPLLSGLRAYFQQDYDSAAETLRDLDGSALREIGGSNAQRDVFDLLRIDAHLKSGEERNWQRARDMICGRTAWKAESPLNDRLRARFERLHTK